MTHLSKANPILTPGEWAVIPVPRNVTFGTKRAVFKAYGVSLLRRPFYTIDHLVPLELGGTNSIKNLWPQPRAEAKHKDLDENALARAVHSGRMTQAEATVQILKSWRGKV